MGINLGEGLLITGLVVFFFGGKKIPELGKTLGSSIRGFKEGMKEEEKTNDSDKKDKKVAK
ncbi:MAG: twin-arginine translocase TatA/TatE family subunit [Bacteriovorax sp.]|nr:twin-arginine translocase TatA/TatE family subunit [Bacteriovorax sp.]